MVGRLIRIVQALPAPVRRLLRRVPGLRRLWEGVMGHPRSAPPASGSKRPVVYLPTWLTWDRMRQRPQYLVAAFAAAGHPTYFVDFHSSEYETPEGIKVVSSLRGVPGEHPILYVHYPRVRHLFERFVDPVVVYDVLDDLSIFDPHEIGIPPQQRVRAHHAVVMRDADVVMASSRVLFDKHLVERNDLVLVRNGVDPSRFGAPHPRPPDLPDDRPIVGYHGAVAHWFDFDLFESVARSNRQWHFVLVGPVAQEVRSRARGLEALDNVDLLGERSSEQVAGYVQNFDVGTIWFVMNDLTSGVDPLKMYEYLAAGVPVVATPLPACRHVPGVSVASSADEFAREIERVLDRPTIDGRLVETAQGASWGARLEPVLARLEELGVTRVPQ